MFLIAFFATFIVISLITILVMLIIVCKKAYGMRIILHFCWIIFTIIMIYCFLIGAATFLASRAALDACTIVGKSITDKNFAIKILNKE